MNVNRDGAGIGILRLRFDMNPVSINHTWGNSVRADGGIWGNVGVGYIHTRCWLGLQLKSVNIKDTVS